MDWQYALDSRNQLLPDPAVYVIHTDRAFGRLKGMSRILYIGSTGELGGNSEKCRLRIYKYPNGKHAREMRRRCQDLVDLGFTIKFRWRYIHSKADAETTEKELLKKCLRTYGELPPFNGKI